MFAKWCLVSNDRTSNLIGLSLDLLNYYRTDSNINCLNIEQTWTCSSIGNRTQTTYFWLRTIEHWTLNIVLPITRNYMNSRLFGVRYLYVWSQKFGAQVRLPINEQVEVRFMFEKWCWNPLKFVEILFDLAL